MLTWSPNNKQFLRPEGKNLKKKRRTVESEKHFCYDGKNMRITVFRQGESIEKVPGHD